MCTTARPVLRVCTCTYCTTTLISDLQTPLNITPLKYVTTLTPSIAINTRSSSFQWIQSKAIVKGYE